MAEVEIYKIKKTAPPKVREYSVFDYMRSGEPPNPLHYVREWAGEMHGTLPLTIPGRLMLEPPKGYHGGNIANGDIAVVNGTPYFMDHLSGSKFVETDFVAAAVRDEIHVRYGWFVDITGAEAISDNLSYVCEDIGIPCGYLGETKAAIGVYNDRRPFLPGASGDNHLSFLHPEFLKGEEARAFTSLLSELTESERWPEIFDYLREYYPAGQQDLEKAREQFAPELLLPEELRSLSKVIPAGADHSELDYLAAKVGGMNEEQRNIFDAVAEAGWHCGSIAEIINLTENLNCFDIEPTHSEAEYGAYRLEYDWDLCEEAVNRLEKSEDPADRALRRYITLLSRSVDDETYGYHAAKEEGGAFTAHGFIRQVRGMEDIYCGAQDILAEYHAPAPTPTVEKTDFIMVGNNIDLSALLLQMHALGGDYMRDAKHNLQTLASGGNEFFIVMNDQKLTVTPAEPLFHKGTNEHETWMAMDKTPDIRTFVMSVTNRSDDRVFGSLCETSLEALNSSIRNNCITHNDPASEGQLAAYLDVFRWAIEQNRRAIPTEMFGDQINAPFVAQSHAPKTAGFRVSPETARTLLAQDAVFIFKAYPEPVARLMPIDAAKASLWTGDKFEYFVKYTEWEKLERWAQRASVEMLRQTERGEHKKSRDAEI